MITTEMKIQEILDRGFDVPSVFKSVLKKESVFTCDEEILDVILLEREYMDGQDKKSNVYSKAQLLIATSYALVLIEEGLDELSENYLGYKIKYIVYSRIASVELDICLLLGIFKISIDASSNNEIAVKFNTAKYKEYFDAFIDVVLKRMIDYMPKS